MKKARQLSYGPYTNIAPLTYEFLRVHFVYSFPMPMFTEAMRTIEISHWGNIKVDEYFNMFNEAAGIKGEFGRVDFNSYNPNDGKQAVKSLETQLPRYIKGLYYHDYIGNISSSEAFRGEDYVRF